MSLRVTQQSTVRSMLWHLNRRQGALAAIQEQLGTLRRINRPSDDPTGVARVLSVRTQLDRLARFEDNILLANERLGASVGSLQTVNDLLSEARQVVLSAASGTVSASERRIMASDVEQILNSVVQLANTRHGGRYLFAGTAVQSKPYELVGIDAPAPVTFHGNNEVVRYQVDFEHSVEGNVPGQRVFRAGQDGDLFAVLARTCRVLRNDEGRSEREQVEELSGLVDQLDRSRERVLAAVGSIGSQQEALERTASRLSDHSLTLRTLLSETEDADMVELLSRLRQQQTALEAALVAAAQIIRPTLVDALK